MSSLMRRLTQIARLAAKEWRLLLRNPHGLAVLFLMPAVFVLVMSFTLKNTLIVRVELPATGWVLEDNSPVARQWTNEWISRHGGQRFASRQELLAALRRGRCRQASWCGPPWMGDDGRPRSEQLEMWLDNLVQPAAAARLRAELSFSLLQVQMKIAAAEAGPFASVLLGSADSGELLSAQGAPTVRYLYEIESGRTMTAVQQSVPAWLIFGMFFVVIPDRRGADPGTQRRHLGASRHFRGLARRHAGWKTAGLHAAELGAAGLHAAGGPLARAAAGRRRAAPGHLRPPGSC